MDRRLVEERRRAREIKAEQRVLVIFGNPPYDRQQIDPEDTETQRKGGWVRFGDDQPGTVPQTPAEAQAAARTARPILQDFIEPAQEAGAGIHLKNLYNDYVYFWRWAIWKLLEQPDDNQGGILSFITASSYLAGPGFVGMREVMRRVFDELWIINLGGDNLGARKSENVFAIRTPVAIAIGLRRGAPAPDTAAEVHYTKIEGTRSEKLAPLSSIADFSDQQWVRCPTDWHSPFLPIGNGDYFAWPALTDIFPWQVSGAQIKRNWPVHFDRGILEERWNQLCEMTFEQKIGVFRETRDRKVAGIYPNIDGLNQPSLSSIAVTTPVRIERYLWRSFDEEYLICDTRVADFIRSFLWSTLNDGQIFLVTLLDIPIGNGPSAHASACVPDMNRLTIERARRCRCTRRAIAKSQCHTWIT